MKPSARAVLAAILPVAASCTFHLPHEQRPLPEIRAPRDPGANPMVSGVPLVASSPGGNLICGGRLMEPDKLQVEATADQLCITKAMSDTIAVGDDRAPQQHDGNRWRLASDAKHTEVFDLIAQGAPQDLGWCNQARGATPDEVQSGRAQAAANGRVVTMTAVRVAKVILRGCVANNGVLTAGSTELAVRILTPQQGGTEDDLVAWGFASAPRS